MYQPLEERIEKHKKDLKRGVESEYRIQNIIDATNLLELEPKRIYTSYNYIGVYLDKMTPEQVEELWCSKFKQLYNVDWKRRADEQERIVYSTSLNTDKENLVNIAFYLDVENVDMKGCRIIEIKRETKREIEERTHVEYAIFCDDEEKDDATKTDQA